MFSWEIYGIGILVSFAISAIIIVVFHDEIVKDSHDYADTIAGAVAISFVASLCWIITIALFICMGIGTLLKKKYKTPIMNWYTKVFKDKK